jgi:general stress protein YciG
MSSFRERLTRWLGHARVRLASAASRVAKARAPRRNQALPQPPLVWRTHDLAERVARRGRRAAGIRRAGSPQGGRAVLSRYGARFFAAIGALGGATLAEERGPQYMHDIGARGGAATRRRYGREHYTQLGRKGGLAGRGSKRPRRRPAGQLELPLA